MNTEIKRYLSEIGTRGGAAGTGEKKQRGDSQYYRELAKLSAQARKQKHDTETQTAPSVL